MPTFIYEGRDVEGAVKTGKLEAVDLDDARDQLRQLLIQPTSLAVTAALQPPLRGYASDPLMLYLSPGIQAPVSFSKRRFSFSIEFYHSLRKNHQRLIAMFCRMFPSPLVVTAKELERAGLSGERSRGGVVRRDGIEGRLIGRHSSTGAPVVAWDQDAFEAMCESFDAENAARIVGWRSSSERLRLSSEGCARAALWLDNGLRVVSWGSGALMGLSTLIGPLMLGGMGGGAEISLLAELGIFLFSAVLITGMVGLSMLLLVGVPMFIMMRLGALAAGLWVGLWASRAHRAATVTDETGRLSAAAIIASMQESVAREDTVKKAPYPVVKDAL